MEERSDGSGGLVDQQDVDPNEESGCTELVHHSNKNVLDKTQIDTHMKPQGMSLD